MDERIRSRKDTILATAHYRIKNNTIRQTFKISS